MPPRDGLADLEKLGAALSRIPPEPLKLLAVIRHLMDKENVDVLGAIAIVDASENPDATSEDNVHETFDALWTVAGELSKLGAEMREPDVLTVESVVSAFTGEPRVSIALGEHGGTYGPQAARHHAMGVLEAAIAAESDAALHAFTREGGAGPAEAARMIMGIREQRGRYREALGEPETYRSPT